MKTLFDIKMDLSKLIACREKELANFICTIAYYKEMEVLSEEDTQMKDIWQRLVDDKRAELKRLKSAYSLL